MSMYHSVPRTFGENEDILYCTLCRNVVYCAIMVNACAFDRKGPGRVTWTERSRGENPVSICGCDERKRDESCIIVGMLVNIYINGFIINVYNSLSHSH